MTKTKDKNKDVTIHDIYHHVKCYKNVRSTIDEVNKKNSLKIKYPNISSDMSENLTKILITNNVIFKDKFGDNVIVDLVGRNNKKKCNDLLINNKHKIEVKCTTSGTGLVTISKNNVDCYAWVWLDFKNLINNISRYIDVHVILNPSNNIHPWHIKTNNEYKMNIIEMKKGITDYNDYKYYELDFDELKLIGTKGYNTFF